MEDKCLNIKLFTQTKLQHLLAPTLKPSPLDNLLFCSGQIPLDAQTGELLKGSAAEQTKKVMENVRAVLEAAGTNFKHVIKCGIFLKNMDDFAAVNEVYASYFGEKPPARSCVEVSRLPKDVDVEIEVIATL